MGAGEARMAEGCDEFQRAAIHQGRVWPSAAGGGRAGVHVHEEYVEECLVRVCVYACVCTFIDMSLCMHVCVVPYACERHCFLAPFVFIPAASLPSRADAVFVWGFRFTPTWCVARCPSTLFRGDFSFAGKPAGFYIQLSYGSVDLFACPCFFDFAQILKSNRNA